jgi:transcriptional regulator with XRE-family HTH domain
LYHITTPLEKISMSNNPLITGRLIAAARILTGISQADLASASGVPLSTVARMEAGGGAPLQSKNDAEALSHALEEFGAMFIPESDGFGAGVKLKFSRLDVKEISRLEGEGGMVKDDDVP